jgi:hypothetical protein
MNLRSDPFEEADKASLNYWPWRLAHLYMLVPAGALIAQFMQSMLEFPPRQSPESWTPGAMLEEMRKKAEALKTGAHPG